VRDRRIELVEINSFPLQVTFSYPSSLVARGHPRVAVNLSSVDPTCTNHSHVGLAVHNFPDFVLVNLGIAGFQCSHSPDGLVSR
jgi:hypothetical protein